MIKEFSATLSNFKKKLLLIVSDFFIIILSLVTSFSLRLEVLYPPSEINQIIYLVYLAIIYGVFNYQGIYQILLRYLDYHAIYQIIKSIIICSLIIIPFNFLLYEIIYFPRSVSFISVIIIMLGVMVHRIIIYFIINLNFEKKIFTNNIMIIGIDQNNIKLIDNIRNQNNYGEIKVIIDPSGKYKKREYNGIKILRKNNLFSIIKKKLITEIIIGNKSIKKKEIKEIYNKLYNQNIKIKNLNNTGDFLNNFISQTILSNINLFDVIDRPKIKVEEEILKKKIKNKNILITGGGGSIGSELCLEILKHNPKKLYILELSEINLFNLITKIKNDKNFQSKIIVPIIGDCGDKSFLKSYFKNINIEEVYHAAAYKHVDFGEKTPYSMIKNNVFGTKSIIDFAIEKKIKSFVFISSDKAVKPKSILGVTKKLGEKLVKFTYENNKINLKTNFTIIRFGNVIGSSGSVIPIFLKQIKNNEPLTVTNIKAKRYFMTISEAVQLVINASYLNKKKLGIYALDMGEQVNIYKIAEKMIKLSGNTLKNISNPNGDIPIKIIGLKKGEKVSEEITLGDNLEQTSHNQIMECNEKIYFENLNNDLKKIENILKNKITINDKYKFIKKFN
jgi:FlaA1/EpsC-like NDP-sugar epimerase